MSVRQIRTQEQVQAEIHQPQTIDISVRQIHTQEQAQAEIHRLRTINKARYLQRKERILNDVEYREQQLQSRKAARDRKHKTIEDNPLHIDARKEADRLAKFRRVIKEAEETRNAQEREEMIEKVHQRYFSSQFFLSNTL